MQVAQDDQPLQVGATTLVAEETRKALPNGKSRSTGDNLAMAVGRQREPSAGMLGYGGGLDLLFGAAHLALRRLPRTPTAALTPEDAPASKLARCLLDPVIRCCRTSAAENYFERARRINLLLAHDSEFRRFEPGVRPAAPTRSHTVADSAAAATAMAYLEQLYPGRISEACLIDSTGTELSRVVRQSVAPAEELSTEEAENPFFVPTMRPSTCPPRPGCRLRPHSRLPARAQRPVAHPDHPRRATHPRPHRAAAGQNSRSGAQKSTISHRISRPPCHFMPRGEDLCHRVSARSGDNWVT